MVIVEKEKKEGLEAGEPIRVAKKGIAFSPPLRLGTAQTDSDCFLGRVLVVGGFGGEKKMEKSSLNDLAIYLVS